MNNHIPTPRRIMISITPREARALAALAHREKREPKQQASMLIRQGLGLDGLTVTLSPMSTAILTQVAKDEGLNSVNEALEYLVINAVTGDYTSVKEQPQ